VAGSLRDLARPCSDAGIPAGNFSATIPSAMSWLKWAPQPVSSTIARLWRPSVSVGSFPGGGTEWGRTSRRCPAHLRLGRRRRTQAACDPMPLPWRETDTNRRPPLVKAGRLIPSAGAARHHPDLPRPDPGPEVHRETNRWHPQRKREIMGLMQSPTRPPRSAVREQTPIVVSELADQYLMRRVRSAIVSNRLEDGSSLNFLWIGGGIAGPGSILRPRTAAISE